MDRFTATMAEDAVTSSNRTVGLVGIAATTRRARLYEFTLSHGSAPEEKTVNWTLGRIDSSLGTSTAVVPAKLDLGSPASAFTGTGENASAEPTYTSAQELWQHALNQRNTFRWVASPYGEIVLPAVNPSGVGWKALSTDYTGVAEVTGMWVE